MRVIRNSVFETNSSSVHTITVKRNRSGRYDYDLGLNSKGEFVIQFGLSYNFGWGPAMYNQAKVKINYLACMIVETSEFQNNIHNRPGIKKIEDILKIKDFKKLETCIRKKVPSFTGFTLLPLGEMYNFTSYGFYLMESIDHQSWQSYKNIEDFLQKNKVSMENFIFNPAVKLIIDNDN